MQATARGSDISVVMITMNEEKAVGKGDQWKREANIPFGPLGSFKAASDYTYQGKEDSYEKIALKSQLTYTPPKDFGREDGA